MKMRLCVMAVIVVAVSFVLDPLYASLDFYNGAPYVPGEILVRLKSRGPSVSSGPSALQGLLARFQISAFHPVSKRAPLFLIKSEKKSVQELLRHLNADPAVAYAEPNYIYHLVSRGPMLAANDPKFDQLWGLENSGQPILGLRGLPGSDIDALRAWDLSTGSQSMIVAIIDTGVDYRHADLAANMWTNGAEVADNGVDDDHNGFIDDVRGWNFQANTNDPFDDYGHGTHVAGTIGAVGNNGIGVVGVNWSVTLMPLKFLDRGGYGTLEGAVKAIEYAVKMGAKVLNNSWGGEEYSQALSDAIAFAESKGVIFVAAAGNDGLDNDEFFSYPSNDPHANVIAVAASNSRDQLASWSNYGKDRVDLMAPGSAILSTLPNDRYGYFDGTSMATPHVVGAAALLWSYLPDLTMSEVIDRLLKGTDEIPSAKRTIKTSGRLNLYNALLGIEAPRAPAVDPSTWAITPFSISTPHEYQNEHEMSWTVHHPGASAIAVRFSSFATEEGYDKVTITDARGLVYDVLSGPLGSLWSGAVSGDTLIIHFESDSSVTAYGFDIDQYAVAP